MYFLTISALSSPVYHFICWRRDLEDCYDNSHACDQTGWNQREEQERFQYVRLVHWWCVQHNWQCLNFTNVSTNDVQPSTSVEHSAACLYLVISELRFPKYAEEWCLLINYVKSGQSSVATLLHDNWAEMIDALMLDLSWACQCNDIPSFPCGSGNCHFILPEGYNNIEILWSVSFVYNCKLHVKITELHSWLREILIICWSIIFLDFIQYMKIERAHQLSMRFDGIFSY
jgi:hypothetical protein